MSDYKTYPCGASAGGGLLPIPDACPFHGAACRGPLNAEQSIALHAEVARLQAQLAEAEKNLSMQRARSEELRADRDAAREDVRFLTDTIHSLKDDHAATLSERDAARAALEGVKKDLELWRRAKRRAGPKELGRVECERQLAEARAERDRARKQVELALEAAKSPELSIEAKIAAIHGILGGDPPPTEADIEWARSAAGRLKSTGE